MTASANGRAGLGRTSCATCCGAHPSEANDTQRTPASCFLMFMRSSPPSARSQGQRMRALIRVASGVNAAITTIARPIPRLFWRDPPGGLAALQQHLAAEALPLLLLLLRREQPEDPPDPGIGRQALQAPAFEHRRAVFPPAPAEGPEDLRALAGAELERRVLERARALPALLHELEQHRRGEVREPESARGVARQLAREGGHLGGLEVDDQSLGEREHGLRPARDLVEHRA